MRLSDLSRFRIEDGRVVALDVLAYGFPGEIHQIDAIDGCLWIPHTGFNQILRIPLDRLHEDRPEPTYYPRMSESLVLDIPRPSHLNSVFHDEVEDQFYVLAHNLTAHTGRPSAIYRLDRDLKEVARVATLARSAHNVYVEDGAIYYCDSERNTFCRDGRTIFETSKLLRGLSVTDEHFIVGGSDISFHREERYSSDVSLYRLNRKGDLISQVDIPELGNLYEIRQVLTEDLAMGGGTS